MTMDGYDKPLPRPTPVDQPYWDGLKTHRMLVQQCDDCGTRQWYPREMCSACSSFSLSWAAVEPEGEVYTFTTQHHPTGSKFDADIPYTVVVVRLDEAPEINLVGRLVGTETAAVRIGMKVAGAYLDATEDFSLLLFRPAGASEGDDA
jgi:uncharacterized OB-fold protein